MSVSIDEIQELEKRTQEIEEKKSQKKSDREQKKVAKEKFQRRQLIEKLVAPVLFILTIVVSWVISLF